MEKYFELAVVYEFGLEKALELKSYAEKLKWADLEKFVPPLQAKKTARKYRRKRAKNNLLGAENAKDAN